MFFAFYVLKCLKRNSTISIVFITSLRMNEQLRVIFVKLFLYKRQINVSKTNAWNITITEKKKKKKKNNKKKKANKKTNKQKTNLPVVFLVALNMVWEKLARVICLLERGSGKCRLIFAVMFASYCTRAATAENVPSDTCAHRRFRSACAYAQFDQIPRRISDSQDAKFRHADFEDWSDCADVHADLSIR